MWHGVSASTVSPAQRSAPGDPGVRNAMWQERLCEGFHVEWANLFETTESSRCARREHRSKSEYISEHHRNLCLVQRVYLTGKP